MIFWNKICGFVLFLLITCLTANAQNPIFIKLNNATLLFKNKLNTPDSLIHFVSPASVFTGFQYLKPPVSANFSTGNYGFFCREELVIEKITKIPLRFRLGSLQQCNYYEGKRQ